MKRGAAKCNEKEWWENGWGIFRHHLQCGGDRIVSVHSLALVLFVLANEQSGGKRLRVRARGGLVCSPNIVMVTSRNEREADLAGWGDYNLGGVNVF